MRGDTHSSLEPVCLERNHDLDGMPVLTSFGARFGVLDGVVVSAGSGAINYFVVSRTRLFGLRRRRMLLPRSSLILDPLKGALVLAPTGEEAPASMELAATPDLQPATVEASPAVEASSPVSAVGQAEPVHAEPARAEVPSPVLPGGPAAIRLDPARG